MLRRGFCAEGDAVTIAYPYRSSSSQMEYETQQHCYRRRLHQQGRLRRIIAEAYLNGERVVVHPTQLTIESAGCEVPAPIVMLARDIGTGEPVYAMQGARQPVGLRTIGLLVKVSGRVSAAGEGFFYLNDGSDAYDGVGPSGIRIHARGDIPTPGQFVSVIGISSCENVGDGIVPVLLMRKPSDMQIIE